MRLINWDTMPDNWFTRKLAATKQSIKPLAGFEMLDNSKSVFVHIPKNAGSTVSKTFFNTNVYLGHYKWWFYQACLKEKYEDYFSFAFKRDPYTRLVSAYSYIKRGGNSLNDKNFYSANSAKFKSFDIFVSQLEKDINMRSWVHFQPQTDFIFDHSDKLRIKHLASFESFNEEMKKIEKIIPAVNEISHQKKGNNSGPEQLLTNDKTINIIRDIYARDFQLLGYKDSI
jgi:hypothetical protein